MSLSSRRARAEAPAARPRDVIRGWDRRAIEEFRIPGIVLMENAGAGAARIIDELRLEEPLAYPQPFSIWCGPGNNGGDGFVVARHLHNRGLRVLVNLASAAGYDGGSDAAVNLEIVRRMKIPLVEPGEAAPGDGTVIDALFGTGLSRPLRPPYLGWVRAINAAGRTVVSLDVPSGLDADTGEVLGEALRARDTITFAAPKLGFYRARGPEHCGTIHVVDIGIPRQLTAGD